MVLTYESYACKSVHVWHSTGYIGHTSSYSNQRWALCDIFLSYYSQFPLIFLIFWNPHFVQNRKNWCFLCYQVFGAFWYLFSIERETTCWQRACHKTGCVSNSLYCDADVSQRNNAFLNVSCSLVEDNPPFDFGIFLDALKSGVVGSMNFPQKFFYCFWWGLRNLRYVHCLY